MHQFDDLNRHMCQLNALVSAKCVIHGTFYSPFPLWTYHIWIFSTRGCYHKERLYITFWRISIFKFRHLWCQKCSHVKPWAFLYFSFKVKGYCCGCDTSPSVGSDEMNTYTKEPCPIYSAAWKATFVWGCLVKCRGLMSVIAPVASGTLSLW
jgi:hypothetical protein